MNEQIDRILSDPTITFQKAYEQIEQYLAKQSDEKREEIIADLSHSFEIL